MMDLSNSSPIQARENNYEHRFSLIQHTQLSRTHLSTRTSPRRLHSYLVLFLLLSRTHAGCYRYFHTPLSLFQLFSRPLSLCLNERVAFTVRHAAAGKFVIRGANAQNTIQRIVYSTCNNSLLYWYDKRLFQHSSSCIARRP